MSFGAKTGATTSHTPSKEATADAQKFKAYKVSQTILSGIKKTARSVCWSCVGDRVAVGSEQKIYIFPSPQHKAKPGMKEIQLLGTSDITSLVWHPTDSNIIAATSTDNTLRFWDVKGAKITQTQANIEPSDSRDKDKLKSISWSPDASMILLTSANYLHIFEPKKTAPQNIRTQKVRQEFNQTLFSRDGKLLLVATSSEVKGTAPGVIQLYRPDNITPEGRYELNAHTGMTTCLSTDKAGKLFASGGADGIINIWDMDEVICTHSICNTDERVNSLSFSHDGKLIACACDTHIFVNHVASGEQIFSQKLSALCVSFHPSKYVLAIAGDDDRSSNQPTFARLLEFNP